MKVAEICESCRPVEVFSFVAVRRNLPDGMGQQAGGRDRQRGQQRLSHRKVEVHCARCAVGRVVGTGSIHRFCASGTTTYHRASGIKSSAVPIHQNH